jgi:hypothetical protein
MDPRPRTHKIMDVQNYWLTDSPDVPNIDIKHILYVPRGQRIKLLLLYANLRVWLGLVANSLPSAD